MIRAVFAWGILGVVAQEIKTGSRKSKKQEVLPKEDPIFLDLCNLFLLDNSSRGAQFSGYFMTIR